MKYLQSLICIGVIVAIMLTLGSCGTKKEKARAALGTTSTAAAVIEDSESVDDPLDDATEASSGYGGQVATITRHKYEFYDYYQQNSRYNSMGYNALTNYHPYYISKYFDDFRKIKNYIFDTNADVAELTYECKLQSDGSRKYVDKASKEITDKTIIEFFKNHDLVSTIRVNNSLGARTFYADFFVPSFVNDLDYMLTMSAVFSNTLVDEEMLNSSESTMFAKKVEDGWCYYVAKNVYAKIKVVN